MGFSYNKLWKLALDNNLNKTQLRDYVGISNGSLSKLSKNEPISMETIGKICRKMHCDISDVVEYVDNTGEDSDGKKKGK